MLSRCKHCSLKTIQFLFWFFHFSSELLYFLICFVNKLRGFVYFVHPQPSLKQTFKIFQIGNQLLFPFTPLFCSYIILGLFLPLLLTLPIFSLLRGFLLCGDTLGAAHIDEGEFPVRVKRPDGVHQWIVPERRDALLQPWLFSQVRGNSLYVFCFFWLSS